MGIVRLSDTRFRVQIRRKGFPPYDRVFPSLQEAQAARDAALVQRNNTQDSAEDMTLSMAWESYRLSSDFHDKSENTRKTEEGRIKPVLASLGGYSLANLAAHPRVIKGYIDERRGYVSKKTGRSLSRTSRRLEIAALSSVVAWAVGREYLLRNFVADVTRPGLTKRKRRVPQVEQGKLEIAVMRFDEPRLAEAARFLLLLRFLGCRPGELAGVLRADIRFVKKDITFRSTKYQEEDRLVHVTGEAMSLLDAQYKEALELAPESPFLFTTKSRKKDEQGDSIWGKYNYSCGVKRLREEGVVAQDFHAHAMRREFISRAIESGLPYSTIRKQTGHHSTQAIEIYDQGLSTAPDIRKALDEHEQATMAERLDGILEAHGFSRQDIEKFMAKQSGEIPSPIKVVLANGEFKPVNKKKKG